MSKINLDIDCTRRCRSKRCGQSLTSAITKRCVSDECLASFIKATCANFTKAFDFEGRTALHMTASRGRNQLMEWLLRHSMEAFVNARDRESGYTPLHRSIFYGQIHSAVALIKLGVNTDIVDKDDYTALDHAMLDRHYIYKHIGEQPSDVYVWGTNSNYTLGTGTQQQRNAPDLLTSFSRTNNSVKQVCLGKFHSVWVCESGQTAGGEAWCAGQTARAGGPPSTALRPAQLRLPEPCLAAAITLTSTVFLLQSGAVVQYGLNSTDNISSSTAKTPTVIKLGSTKPLLKLADPLGVCAGRLHAVAWNPRVVYTWGTNLGQLGHPQEDKVVPLPKRVAVSINTKDQTEIQLVATSDAATVFTTSRGDVYLLHKYLCKKIVIKQINLRQVCVESKVSDQNIYSRVTVLLLTNVGQLHIWQDTNNRLTRCVFGLNHQILISHVALTHDALYFITKYGEAYIGNISRKTGPAIQPAKRDKDSNKSSLVLFLEKDDCTSVRITKIPNIHRAVSISVDNEGLNFACLQIKPTCGLTSLPELPPSLMSKHMESLLDLATEDDILHDVIFKVNNKLYPAHIFIVASSSEYLYKMYEESRTNADDKPIVCLDNVHPEVFERILHYMYTGSCDVTELGPCRLKIRKEDLNAVIKKEKNEVDIEIDAVENPKEVSAFEVYNGQHKRNNKHRRSADTPPRSAHCDPVKLLQASAKRLKVMALHKLLDKYYYRDGIIHVKESATHTKSSPAFDRESFPQLVDTNVCCKDGTLLPAHKCVLAARLDYFNGMFMHSWTESETMSTVTLPINYSILLPIINFLYTDRCPEIENSDSIDFICSMLIVADQLLITRIREMCEVTLASLITLKNCAELCQFAHTYNATQLKQCCMEFIGLNICNILENRSLDLLDDILVADISHYYRNFNPIMLSRIITPFFNSPTDEIVNELAKNSPVNMSVIDEDLKKDDSILEANKKKSKQSKKIEYTESEKARMRYESVSSITSLDLSYDTSGDVTLSLSSIGKEKEKKQIEKKDKWIEVPSAQQKQQKVIQARLKAITTAKDILNESPTESFTKLTKSNSSTVMTPTKETHGPSTSRMSESPKELFPESNWSPQCNLVVNHIGPKLSQKQRKKLAMQGNEVSTPQNLDNYLSNKINIGSPPDKPKNPWKICEAPIASSSPKSKAIEFNQILADQKKQKDDFSRIMTKPLALTQLEDKAIEELERFYNVHEIDDEWITVRRIELQVSSPQWIHTAPK
ncbi:PREDICTED: inhibitor of Bruton tyrosine kinase [Papilio polytes]|nr:PREDICTED: inhibitor of Bruton tyrosine kinase [Papilio polytes]